MGKQKYTGEIVPAQLSLSVGLRDDATLANFLAGDNQVLVAHLQQQLLTCDPQYLYIWGKKDSGRSHLLQAACHASGHQDLRSLYLPLRDLASLGIELLEGLDELDLICIDDVEAVLGQAIWEEALFHLFNRMRNKQHRLLISGNAPPQQLPTRLPDLASRLAWGLIYQVQPLDDIQKLAALQLRARQRGLELNDEVARYILHRSPRAMRELFRALEKLDRASLSAQRKLTIPFVKEAMRW
ncbi:DnaA regulatory inactivator Hda [Allopseudospirillum japonicum]|nr:DnaA regulatory inactivator Hda [Allopseudospirillum japonicum]